MIRGVVVLTAVAIILLKLLVDLVCAVLDPGVWEQRRRIVEQPDVMRAAP